MNINYPNHPIAKADFSKHVLSVPGVDIYVSTSRLAECEMYSYVYDEGYSQWSGWLSREDVYATRKAYLCFVRTDEGRDMFAAFVAMVGGHSGT